MSVDSGNREHPVDALHCQGKYLLFCFLCSFNVDYFLLYFNDLKFVSVEIWTESFEIHSGHNLILSINKHE